LFYCSSHVINEANEIVGHTDSYFHDIWKETRWDSDFVADGPQELVQFQMRGQTVPNMSSALIKATAYTASFTPFLKRLKLTGDWLFIGDVMQHGRVIFSHETLSRFRKHEVTARVRVKSARSQAEFILTKTTLFSASGQAVRLFSGLIQSDVIRFLYEPATGWDVTKAMLEISWMKSLRFFGLFLISISMNGSLIQKFKERYKHTREVNKK